jgi:membrane protein
VRSQTGIVGLVLVVASAINFARALQATYQRVWDQPPGTGMIERRQCAFWLLGWVTYLLTIALTTQILGLGTAWSPGRLVAQSVTATVLWTWTARTLLRGRVSWSELWVGGVLTGVGTTMLSEASRLVMPRYVASNVQQFGPWGLVFALASWLIVFTTVIVFCAVVGRVIVEDEWIRDTVLSLDAALRRRRGVGGLLRWVTSTEKPVE